jgi:S-adenosylmethionine-diacylglycerol 3-amino-3-carboxypropyl transferase
MPVKFAVVREDPQLELELVQATGARAVLVVASGGCTALALKHARPDLQVTAFDLNPDQLAHVRAKAAAVASGDTVRLNVGNAAGDGLNQCGEFESLFRVLRRFVEEFVTSQAQLRRFFEVKTSEAERARLREEWFASRFWPAAFTTAFNDGFLTAMFGPRAVQHAEPGSYPRYFQRVFEEGLTRPEAWRNPFLQHVWIGWYRAEDAPAYVHAGRELPIELVQGSLGDVPELSRFDVLSLSNVFDWSDDAETEGWGRLLAERAKPGAVVLIRQLNNRRPVERFFAPAFRFDEARAAKLLQGDRSLFYERLLVGTKA